MMVAMAMVNLIRAVVMTLHVMRMDWWIINFF
jgi:hypothetical protein